MTDLRILTWDEASGRAFALGYAARSGISLLDLETHGRVALPCDCGDEICDGWQMGYASDFERWLSVVSVPVVRQGSTK
jgi:hypothetical protein